MNIKQASKNPLQRAHLLEVTGGQSDLSIFTDANLTMCTKVTQTCLKCLAALWQLRSIHRSVSSDVMQSLIVMDRFQSVQNVVAWLIFKACRQDHIQPLLSKLHWLRTTERVSFRLTVLVYRCLHGSAQGYLASDLQRVTFQCTSTPALFDYVSAGRSTHCAFCHWRLHLSSDCCIGLKQFAEVSLVIAIVASLP